MEPRTRKRASQTGKKPSKAPEFSVREFFKRFPDDDACLHHIMEVRHGLRHTCRACGSEATFHKMTNRKAYACANCGDHVYPCSGTVFQDSRTPLQIWFYAIFLFVTTRHGVSGKELQRQLGVTYKTAWRMGQQIRKLMERAEIHDVFGGHVELDEAYVGGKRPGKRGRGAAGKTIVMGVAERGGRIHARVIPNIKKVTLQGVVNEKVEKGSLVSTDELMSYGLLEGDGYKHVAVKHGAKEWAIYDYRTDAVHHVNSVEGFWKLFKNSVRSTHIHVSKQYMDRYLNEFTFRSNHRGMQNAMFDLLIGAV
ncbi:MAG: IS1595 family transposase [Proteobacteria bacterium]|nr:IS1595 family transposase [Pseudomonadota bacterium]MDA1310036.1 IS1595 family transposase [Pseudomonadota bacterium]